MLDKMIFLLTIIIWLFHNIINGILFTAEFILCSKQFCFPSNLSILSAILADIEISNLHCISLMLIFSYLGISQGQF